MSDTTATSNPVLLPSAQVAARLGVTIRSVDRYVRDPSLGFPQPVVLRRRNYFRADEIDAWIAAMARRAGA